MCRQRLLERGEEVLGLDNMNNYYDVRLKEARLSQADFTKKLYLSKGGPG